MVAGPSTCAEVVVQHVLDLGGLAPSGRRAVLRYHLGGHQVADAGVDAARRDDEDGQGGWTLIGRICTSWRIRRRRTRPGREPRGDGGVEHRAFVAAALERTGGVHHEVGARDDRARSTRVGAIARRERACDVDRSVDGARRLRTMTRSCRRGPGRRRAPASGARRRASSHGRCRRRTRPSSPRPRRPGSVDGRKMVRDRRRGGDGAATIGRRDASRGNARRARGRGRRETPWCVEVVVGIFFDRPALRVYAARASRGSSERATWVDLI